MEFILIPRFIIIPATLIRLVTTLLPRYEKRRTDKIIDASKALVNYVKIAAI